MEGLGILSWIIFGAFTERQLIFGWNLGSFVVAVIGALVLLALLSLLRRD